MAQKKEVVWNKRARLKFKAVIDYLIDNWSNEIAEGFVENVVDLLNSLANNPLMGVMSVKNKSVRRILLTKHNALFYKVKGKRIILLDIFDTRQHPRKSRY